jgi:uroporphyrinogen-III synthase
MKAKTLYLGLNPPKEDPSVTHFPVIRIVPRELDDPLVMGMLDKWNSYTHLLYTSRSAVRVMHKYCKRVGVSVTGKIGISVGQATAKEMRTYGFSVDHVAAREQAEGVVDLLETLELKKASLLWPHSALSRSVLKDYFREKEFIAEGVVVYDTVAVHSNDPPDLATFERIIFTSPSTVDVFMAIYGSLPKDKELIPIGPITHKALENYLLSTP